MSSLGFDHRQRRYDLTHDRLHAMQCRAVLAVQVSAQRPAQPLSWSDRGCPLDTAGDRCLWHAGGTADASGPGRAIQVASRSRRGSVRSKLEQPSRPAVPAKVSVSRQRSACASSTRSSWYSRPRAWPRRWRSSKSQSTRQISAQWSAAIVFWVLRPISDSSVTAPAVLFHLVFPSRPDRASSERRYFPTVGGRRRHTLWASLAFGPRRAPTSLKRRRRHVKKPAVTAAKSGDHVEATQAAAAPRPSRRPNTSKKIKPPASPVVAHSRRLAAGRQGQAKDKAKARARPGQGQGQGIDNRTVQRQAKLRWASARGDTTLRCWSSTGPRPSLS